MYIIYIMYTMSVTYLLNVIPITMSQKLAYAELGLLTASTSHPPPLQEDKVQYAVVKPLPSAPDAKKDVGRTIIYAL